MNIELSVDFSKESEKRRLYHELKKLNGPIDVTIRTHSKKNSRYKYYWGSVLMQILREKIYNMIDDWGNTVLCTNTNQIHDILKLIYCPRLAINPRTGELMKIGSRSTTEMSDSVFIEKYQERIIFDHSQDFFMEFETRESYAASLKARQEADYIKRVNELAEKI